MTLDVTFWDVQHGNACYLRTPDGRHIVYDLGTGSYGAKLPNFSPLTHLRSNLGVAQLDYVVISHPNLDHIDDILSFDHLGPKVLRRPTHIKREDIGPVRDQDKPIFDKYFEINRRYNASVSGTVNDPAIPDHWGGVKLRTFGAVTCSRSNINNHSVVLTAEYAGLKLVLMGDNESASYEELLGQPAFAAAIKNADVLLAAHHGRQSGYHNDFMTSVNPRLTVISDGRFCDTSATSRYAAKTRGWKVHSRSGGSEDRKCVTTRYDGDIEIRIGFSQGGGNFLSVSVA